MITPFPVNVNKKGSGVMNLINNKLLEEITEVLDKYNKRYSEVGIRKNLEDWKYRKGWLIKLLRNHPFWNEDALAVIFDVNEDRGIEEDVVDQSLNMMNDIFLGRCNTAEKSDAVRYIGKLARTYSQTVDTESTAILVRSLGVNCVIGQKTSRVINAICKKYGFDTHYGYEKAFARLSDALNPISIKKTAVLSVHPCDYLEMSNEDNNWTSCACLMYMSIEN